MIGGMTQVTAPTNNMTGIMNMIMMMTMMTGITGGT